MVAAADRARIGSLFKAYDVRGVVPDDLTPDVAYAIGRALVAHLRVDEVAVGRDMRVSGAALTGALIDGVRDQGANVADLGLVSTDALYFAVGKYGYRAGVMVTASHNPPAYNGFKICREEARALSLDEGLAEVRDLALAGDFPAPPNGRRGDVIEREVLTAYADHVLSLVDPAAIKPLKIAIDAGNGMGGLLVPRVFDRLPCTVFPLYFELDGTFPNHLSDPSKAENVRDLQELVRREGCDLGCAFDGDADRMFLIDERGERIGGDLTTAMVAIAMLERHPGAAICYNLICSRSVPETIERHGGRAVRTPVGHSLIKRIMRQEDALFGGEHSGHFYFRDNWYADSGMIALLTVLQLLSKQRAPLSEVIRPLDSRVRSGEINYHVAEKEAALDRIEATYRALGAEIDRLDGITISFPDRWFNVRASNTEPLLRLNVEAGDESVLTALKDDVGSLIRPARAS